MNTIKDLLLAAVAGVVIGLCLMVTANFSYKMGYETAIHEQKIIEMEEEHEEFMTKLELAKLGYVVEDWD